ncbi:MAG: hypothetical protein NC112_00880 [Oxalobacter formigenes]|nr:hypothetical protein [Oxalobacter formigenes]
MRTTEARMGLVWIREGFFLFRKRPFLLINLFIAYFFFMMLAGAFPLVGAVLPSLAAPVFSVFFLQAINGVSEEQPFHFRELLAVFTWPVTLRLLLVGGLYFLAAFIAVWLSRFVDGGLFMRAMGGEQFEVQTLLNSRFTEAFLLAGVLYALSLLFFWFVAPLIAWKNMPVGQSLFYSFFTLIRTWRPFLVYLLGLLTAGFFVPLLINTLVVIFLGRSIGLIFTFSVLMVVMVLVYCSFYCMYIDVFGKPLPIARN